MVHRAERRVPVSEVLVQPLDDRRAVLPCVDGDVTYAVAAFHGEPAPVRFQRPRLVYVHRRRRRIEQVNERFHVAVALLPCLLFFQFQNRQSALCVVRSVGVGNVVADDIGHVRVSAVPFLHNFERLALCQDGISHDGIVARAGVHSAHLPQPILRRQLAF